MLHLNGKQFTASVKKLDDFLNFLGSQGFQVVTAEMETEGVYTCFYTGRRQLAPRSGFPAQDATLASRRLNTPRKSKTEVGSI